MLNITTATLQELKDLSYAEWGNEPQEFDAILIIPNGQIHDSEFQCMDYIVVEGQEAICKVGGGSDVLHIDGIGGSTNWQNFFSPNPTTKPDIPKCWNIDCLPKSGVLRLWCQFCKLCIGVNVSSFELIAYAPEDPIKKEKPAQLEIPGTGKI